MLSDEKKTKYRRFVEQLYLKCQEIQDQNQRYVFRLNKMKKLIKRRSKDVEILKNRLDRYNDAWRHVPIVAPHRTRKTELRGRPKSKSLEAKARKKKAKQDEKLPLVTNNSPNKGTDIQ
ncbi:uncharacterized protein LOC129605921 [Condylostylus longicornis]|uniref:uncharacterized protein LOC129605921 n=1 Tax=Condylostylus longicornis TaxID=2530218 RepID=UPI00244DC893|nr:uncharacterized protein LOC129605921 [Condylostylus longicornis]